MTPIRKSPGRGRSTPDLTPESTRPLVNAVRKNIVQVAGIASVTEAQMLLECGVDFLGFPLRVDVHDEEISEPDAAEIIRSLVPPAFGVPITYLDSAVEIVTLCEKLGATLVQLHGKVASGELAKIRKIQPQLRVIKSIVIHPGAAPDLAKTVDAICDFVDAFITDTFDPLTGASGATGKTHDWRISRCIVEHSPRPVILAGGLTPENVAAAIEQVCPAGVDTHTGVENAAGHKDPERVRTFVSRAREAFARV